MARKGIAEITHGDYLRKLAASEAAKRAGRDPVPRSRRGLRGQRPVLLQGQRRRHPRSDTGGAWQPATGPVAELPAGQGDAAQAAVGAAVDPATGVPVPSPTPDGVTPDAAAAAGVPAPPAAPAPRPPRSRPSRRRHPDQARSPARRSRRRLLPARSLTRPPPHRAEHRGASDRSTRDPPRRPRWQTPSGRPPPTATVAPPPNASATPLATSPVSKGPRPTSRRPRTPPGPRCRPSSLPPHPTRYRRRRAHPHLRARNPASAPDRADSLEVGREILLPSTSGPCLAKLRCGPANTLCYF